MQMGTLLPYKKRFESLLYSTHVTVATSLSWSCLSQLSSFSLRGPVLYTFAIHIREITEMGNEEKLG
jgi:hypothetical protein